MEAEQFEEISRRLENFQSLFADKMKLLEKKNAIIKEKDTRIEILSDKLMKLSKEKDTALLDKIDLIQNFTSEREENSDLISELKQEVLKKEQKIKKLKRKSREAQDGLMGTSFEVDRMKKEVSKKNQEIADIEEKVASISSGSTGILTDISGSVEYIGDRIKKATRSLRLVAPTVEFLQENGLDALMEGLPTSCVVNIATALDLESNAPVIEKWKSHGWIVNNYQGQNFLMSSANGIDVSIAYISGNKVSGFYSNIKDLVSIFRQALMHPFIKGQKL
jgi:hypothetical protein